MNRIIFVFVLIWILFSQCASPQQTSAPNRYVCDVTVFHELNPSILPKTYMFIPLEGQENSLEYKNYASFIRSELTRYGWTEPTTAAIPEMLITFNYAIDTGQVKSYSVPVMGQTGVSSSSTYGSINSSGNFQSNTYNYPTYGVVGSRTESYTEYTRMLLLRIIDSKSIKKGKSKNPTPPKILYEASVTSIGSSNRLLEVLPYMIEAIFRDFPGKSGVIRPENVYQR